MGFPLSIRGRFSVPSGGSGRDARLVAAERASDALGRILDKVELRPEGVEAQSSWLGWFTSLRWYPRLVFDGAKLRITGDDVTAEVHYEVSLRKMFVASCTGSLALILVVVIASATAFDPSALDALFFAVLFPFAAFALVYINERIWIGSWLMQKLMYDR